MMRRNRKQLSLLLVALFALDVAVAQQVGDRLPMEQVYKRKYTATKIDNFSHTVDGRHDEPEWESVGEWSEAFVQSRPVERAVSKYETRMKIFYDDKNIYVGIRCYDDEIDKLHHQIGNRDDWTGDYVTVSFDSYHDYRSASQFMLNAGGTRTDMSMTDQQEMNFSWNAVWAGKSHIYREEGYWFAEYAIPFTQLRYRTVGNDGVWGLHVQRMVSRNDEMLEWSMVPQNNNGVVYSYGEMYGMDDAPRTRNIEFTPYLSGQHVREPRIEGSPYQTGSDWRANVGLDAKMRVGDYTMNMTFNPDFGQVEQDPSVMNLTTTETFYEEKRPFFLEGSDVFSFGINTDNMFYSRRIGAMPSYSPSVDNVTSFVETPKNVPIIGALKLIGTNKNNVSIGIMESVTARSSAHTTIGGNEQRIVTEPLTNYTVARVQKSWEGKTLLGGMLTSVNRSLGEDHLEQSLVANAFTGAVDFSHYFKDRLYYITAKAMFSTMNGTEAAIERKQRNSVHYYQRESAADFLGVDPTRTSLSGAAGFLEVGRKGFSKLQVFDQLSYYSAGFDLNDVGYLARADLIQNTFDISYNQNTPWAIWRNTAIKFTMLNQWDTDGNTQLHSFRFRWDATLKNRWGWWVTQTFRTNRREDRLLRGGPDMRMPAAYWNSFGFFTDMAKKWYVTIDYISNKNMDGSKFEYNIKPSLYARIGNHLLLELAAELYNDRNNLQYAGTIAPDKEGGKKEYVLGRMFQRTYGVTMRAQVNITPDVSVQFYGAPFTSNARYSDFQAAANTLSETKSERLRPLTASEQARMYNPDFSFNEFRSNFVARWEYRPGSTLYFVWEHSRSSSQNSYRAGWDNNLGEMFRTPATNIFMVKLNYYFSL